MLPEARAAEPIPEGEQAALALKIINGWRGTNAAVAQPKLHVVYFTPADREPEPRFRDRLEGVLEDIRKFYRDEMERIGFGPRTFDLVRDAEGKWIIHLVKGKEPESAFKRSGFGQDQAGDEASRRKIITQSEAVLKAAGIAPDKETMLMFCNLAKWDEQAKSFRHHSPYVGFANQTRGWCFAVDSVILDVADIAKQEPMLQDGEWGRESLGKFNTIFIGGVAHEMGHAFSLPHSGERWDEKERGTSLMGSGNHTYREELRGEGKGTFLNLAGAMKLASRPLFSHCDRDASLAPELKEHLFQLSTNVSRRELAERRGALRIEGTVKGTPPVYGVIAYFDSHHQGGYDAPTATSVPDAEGRYAIEISDLAPTANGDLRIEYCHASGAISMDETTFRVTADGKMDLEQWELRNALAPFVVDLDGERAKEELRKLEESNAPELAKKVARKVVAAMQDTPKTEPATAPADVKELALGDARAQSAEVGWAAPAANRIPKTGQVASAYLDSGSIYPTGLFAHARSRYVYNLGGKWKRLHGEGGLHTIQQPHGSVVFVIKGDGKELFRSSVIRRKAKARYDVKVTGVKKLELVVEDGGDGISNDWGLWLEPVLER